MPIAPRRPAAPWSSSPNGDGGAISEEIPRSLGAASGSTTIRSWSSALRQTMLSARLRQCSTLPYTLQPVLQGPLDYFREPAGRHAWLTISGRLSAGRTSSEAQVEIDVLTRNLDRRHPGQHTRIRVTDGAIIHEPETARSMPMLVALCLGTTAVILLLVCANVTTLLLARAVARRREMALRLSLGATRGQLVRQLMTETAMLGGGAGIVSILAAWYLPNRVAQMLTPFPLQETFGPDGRVVALTLGLALLAGGVAGLSPAIETLRVDVADPLRSGGPAGAGRASPRLSGLLITNQLSISLALLIVMAMIGRAQHRMLDARLDYDPATVIVTSIDLGRSGYTGLSARTFYDRLVPALEALPGVRAVAFSSPPPFRGVNHRAVSTAEAAAETRLVSCRAVSPGFFSMTGVRLLEGRLFTDIEARTPGPVMPVMISRSFARRYFPGVSSVGRRIRIGEGDRAEIVGVVSDTISVRVSEPDEPIVYQPLYTATVAGMAPLVQSDADAAGVADMIRARVRALDSRLTARPETVSATIAGESSQYSAVIRVMAIPTSLALFLSLVGVYGLTSFAVAQRTHEIGVRIACGARPRQVVHMFVRSLRRPLVSGLLGGAHAVAGRRVDAAANGAASGSAVVGSSGARRGDRTVAGCRADCGHNSSTARRAEGSMGCAEGLAAARCRWTSVLFWSRADVLDRERNERIGFVRGQARRSFHRRLVTPR